jgi:hypothetical protein
MWDDGARWFKREFVARAARRVSQGYHDISIVKY